MQYNTPYLNSKPNKYNVNVNSDKTYDKESVLIA